MKKFSNQITIMMLSLIFFTACKKNDLPGSSQTPGEIATAKKPQPTATVSKVKTQTMGTTLTYIYDGNGRVKQYSGNEASTFVFQNASGAINFSIYLETGTHVGDYVYPLNAKGLATGVDWGYAKETYTYNSKGNLVKEERLQGNNLQVVTYDYQNGNMSQAKRYVNGVIEWTRTFTYYTELNSISNEAFGKSYMGIDSKNLVKTLVSNHAIAGVSTTTYSYEFDVQGRVLKKKAVNNGTTLPAITFTYY